MGKRKNFNNKELDLLKKLKIENNQLKKEVSSLRKQLNRIEVSYQDDVLDDIHIQEQVQDNYTQNWECHQCKQDIIRLVVFDRIDGTFYFRRCGSCGNRTKVKRYTDSVKGVL